MVRLQGGFGEWDKARAGLVAYSGYMFSSSSNITATFLTMPETEDFHLLSLQEASSLHEYINMYLAGHYINKKFAPYAIGTKTNVRLWSDLSSQSSADSFSIAKSEQLDFMAWERYSYVQE